MDGVNMVLGSREMTVKAAQQCANDRKKWRALVQRLMIEFKEGIFAWSFVLTDRPLTLG